MYSKFYGRVCFFFWFFSRRYVYLSKITVFFWKFLSNDLKFIVHCFSELYRKKKLFTEKKNEPHFLDLSQNRESSQEFDNRKSLEINLNRHNFCEDNQSTFFMSNNELSGWRPFYELFSYERAKHFFWSSSQGIRWGVWFCLWCMHLSYCVLEQTNRSNLRMVNVTSEVIAILIESAQTHFCRHIRSNTYSIVVVTQCTSLRIFLYHTTVITASTPSKKKKKRNFFFTPNISLDFSFTSAIQPKF